MILLADEIAAISFLGSGEPTSHSHEQISSQKQLDSF